MNIIKLLVYFLSLIMKKENIKTTHNKNNKQKPKKQTKAPKNLQIKLKI